MLALGILPYDDARAVLSNPAPWTIAAMFIVMGALVRTGALEWFTQLAEAQAQLDSAEADLIPGAQFRPVSSDFGHCAANPGNDPNFQNALDANIAELLNV